MIGGEWYDSELLGSILVELRGFSEHCITYINGGMTEDLVAVSETL